jgi:ABC-2 type transport system ATP-binding protein
MARQRTTTGVVASDPLVVTDLTKTYPGGVEALRGVSFTVNEGEVFGLLGPNGAGKTTTLGIVTTLVRPSSGRALVGGFDVETNPLDVRRAIGVLFQDSVLDVAFSGEQNLWLHARLWRVPDPGRRIAELVARVGLAHRAADPVGTYSGGMRRRLEIARALLAEPRLLILDEPTLGLDPVARAELWDTVRTLCRERHVTVLVSTHYLEEAQGVCDRVAIADRGAVIAVDTPSALVHRVGSYVLDIGAGGDPALLLAALATRAPRLGTKVLNGSTISILSQLPPAELSVIAAQARLTELGALSVTVRPTTLNDVFLHLTATSEMVELAVPA